MTRIERYGTLRLELINVAGIDNKDADVSYVMYNIDEGEEDAYIIFKLFYLYIYK